MGHAGRQHSYDPPPSPPPHADLFEERLDPSAAVPRRPEAVHIYGVDLLSTGDILKYFADYGGAQPGPRS